MSFIEWRDAFDEIFENYPDRWTLNFVHRNDNNQQRLIMNKRQMERTAYAHFICNKCSHQWSSAKANVIFYYLGRNEPLGRVTMRLFGQQCKQCVRGGNSYVDPYFDTDLIESILLKLHERIGWNCYNMSRPKGPKKDVERQNNIKGPHEESLCEACRLGICQRND